MSLGEGAHWSPPLPTLSSRKYIPRGELLPLQIFKQWRAGLSVWRVRHGTEPSALRGPLSVLILGGGLGAEEGVLDLGVEF